MYVFAYRVGECLQQDTSSPSIPATKQYYSKVMHIYNHVILELQVCFNLGCGGFTLFCNVWVCVCMWVL